jgi:hypothetical protein
MSGRIARILCRVQPRTTGVVQWTPKSVGSRASIRIRSRCSISWRQYRPFSIIIIPGQLGFHTFISNCSHYNAAWCGRMKLWWKACAMSSGIGEGFEHYARECVQLAEQPNTSSELRDQLLQMAREWMQAMMDEEGKTPSDGDDPTGKMPSSLSR